jgi:hypothetical protein
MSQLNIIELHLKSADFSVKKAKKLHNFDTLFTDYQANSQAPVENYLTPKP